MVGVRSVYTCDKCRKEHWSYDEARSCEIDHFVDDASARVKARIDEVFAKSKPVIAKLVRP
jgi:hypothetical protein